MAETTTREPSYLPPTAERERVPQAAIDDVVRQIAAQFHPERIILFGSYAYGNPGPDSDVDLLVVMDTPLGEIQQGIAIRRAISKHFAMDLLVYKPEVLTERLALGDPFLKEITEQGKVLYECHNR